MFKLGVRNDAEGSSKKTEGRTVRTPAVSHISRKEMEAGRDHESEKTTLKDSNPIPCQKIYVRKKILKSGWER